MALIVDPDLLAQGTEVTISTVAKTIKLNIAGDLSTDGVTGQCLYSFLKEEWKTDTNLIKFPFPMISITNEQFEFIEGWKPADDATRKLIRTAGWAEYAAGSTTANRKYCGVISLGTIGGTDQAYFQQASLGTGSSAVNFTYSGPVNEAVQIFGDTDNGNFDYTGYFKLFVRVQGKKYSQSQISDIGVSAMTYIVYRFPLANETDLKITHDDTTISTTAPYTSIDVTYYAADQNVSIGGTNYPFRVIVDGANATAEQIYEKVQYLLRQSSDIDQGSGTVTGKTADSLLTFVGDTLLTSRGVYIENFNNNDTNRLQFTDQTGVVRTYPFVATLTLNFNENLVADSNAVFRVFFTNDDAGSNLGYDFGTANAIIVNDASGTPISGNVGGVAQQSFTYAYDSNVQRGAGSAGVDAPVTVVAQGLAVSQYVRAVGTITRSVANSVSLAGALERNYDNPI
jgi:hypothetical protein